MILTRSFLFLEFQHTSVFIVKVINGLIRQYSNSVNREKLFKHLKKNHTG